VSGPALFQRKEVRRTLQVFVAATAAVVAGTLISPQRWYWALIAAFIVGVGAASRSEVMVKALQRVGGTLFGVLAGIGLATLVAGHAWLAVGLIFTCMFLAFYAFQAAYGTMIFFITLMLALLYGLLGMFQPHLLVLRLEETAVGAAIGIAANFLVLPIRQGEAFREKLADFLDALADAIGRCGAADGDRALHRLQAAKQELRQSLGGVKRGWVPLVSRKYLTANRAAMRCAYLIREAARSGGLERADAEAIVAMVDRLRSVVAKGPGEEIPPLPEPDRTNPMARAIERAVGRLDLRLRQL